MEPLTIRAAETAEEVAQARELMAEYGAEFGFSRWSTTFEQELATLPGRYAPPAGGCWWPIGKGRRRGAGRCGRWRKESAR